VSHGFIINQLFIGGFEALLGMLPQAISHHVLKPQNVSQIWTNLTWLDLLMVVWFSA